MMPSSKRPYSNDMLCGSLLYCWSCTFLPALVMTILSSVVSTMETSQNRVNILHHYTYNKQSLCNCNACDVPVTMHMWSSNHAHAILLCGRKYLGVACCTYCKSGDNIEILYNSTEPSSCQHRRIPGRNFTWQLSHLTLTLTMACRPQYSEHCPLDGQLL